MPDEGLRTGVPRGALALFQRAASRRRLTIAVLAGAVLLCCVTPHAGAAVTPSAAEKKPGSAREVPSFVGGRSCVPCHDKEYRDWSGSDHDNAMQVASDKTVLGDFDNAVFIHFGVTSRFFKRGGKFFVRTEGPDGNSADFEIKYAFGIEPLQQYLVEFPGGRLQSLTIAWDTVKKRWFHLYPDEKISHDDPLHWTGPLQNWNYMCAECHSTNLRKNYRLAEDRYETTWSEIDVSCEACHGPGSIHVQWARQRAAGALAGGDPDMGLVVQLGDVDGATWRFEGPGGIARRSKPRRSRAEVETCGRCHARRSPVVDGYEYGRPLADSHRIALLDERLYHADGQILEEVYVHGSFLQSKMYAAGVTCGDCHDPHSLRLGQWGNAMCGRCHLSTKFDTVEHHHHEKGTVGASCVQCHMPSRHYMVVDLRADHSLRVPRPDLTVKIGTPNACNYCHEDKDAQWAADAVVKWYGPERSEKFHYGEALHAGRNWLPEAGRLLTRVAADPELPGIVRASAFSLLPRHAVPDSVAVVGRALHDGDPLVRAAALMALEGVAGPQTQLRMGFPLLRDPIRTVRLAAARLLAGVPAGMLAPAQRPAMERALEEYRQAQLVNAERPDAHLNLGLMDLRRGELARAESAYRTALGMDPSFVPTYVNLADLYRLQGRDGEGEVLLRRALELAPEDGDVHHALGLLLVRGKRLPEAIEALGQAAELRRDWPRYTYVLGVALHASGQSDRALAVLKRAHERYPGDRDLLLSLATISRESGARQSAIDYAKKLVQLFPRDQGYRQLLEQLEFKRP